MYLQPAWPVPAQRPVEVLRGYHLGIVRRQPLYHRGPYESVNTPFNLASELYLPRWHSIIRLEMKLLDHTFISRGNL